LPPGLPASIFPYEKKENSDAKRHHVIYKTKLIQNPEIFRQFLQLWLLFKVTNMFTNVFTLCDDVIRLPWQPLFIVRDFLTSIMGGYFHTKFLAQTYPEF